MKPSEQPPELREEVLAFIRGRRSLQLATLGEDGAPYASYAPFALGDECFYVLLSDIALHGLNLQRDPRASLLVVEDEDSARELYARIRVNYSVRAEMLAWDTAQWQEGIDCLADRHGERPRKLGKLQDFKLFRLVPTGGRYVKGFGQAYRWVGGGLAGTAIGHMTDGHKKRPRGESAPAQEQVPAAQ